jgi:hypothetical protein
VRKQEEDKYTEGLKEENTVIMKMLSAMFIWCLKFV